MPSPSTPVVTDGRERLSRNVAFAWGGYMVNVVSGFIVPRMISDHLGQDLLGIWDFSWSFVAYFGLVQLGMGGSIGRYVAKHRAVGDTDGLNRSVSTIAIFQRYVGWLALVMAVCIAFFALPAFGSRLGNDLETARWVLLFLGTEIALSISLSVYGAVMSGCHRWDLHNGISASAYAICAVGMILVLLFGGGLPLLALVHCIVMVGSELVRWGYVKKVCPELEIRRDHASWSSFKEQARYSGKSIVPRLATLTSNQALSILITAYLGPASLAIFSRPRSLVQTFRTLAAKFGSILTPSSSSMQAKKDQQGLHDLLLSAPAALSILILPPLVTVAVLGDPIIRAWMGPEYVHSGLVPILAIGTYAAAVQEPNWSILAGMNVHGRLAMIRLIAALVSAGLLALGLGVFGWGLLGAAILFTLPQVWVDGIVGSAIACKKLDVPIARYFWVTFGKPLICNLPYAVGLASGLALFTTHLLLAIGLAVLGVLAWACLTWKINLSAAMRVTLVSRIQALVSRLMRVRRVGGVH